MKAWVAKDEDGNIFLYSNKPEKGYRKWFDFGCDHEIPITKLPEGINPQWSNEEPIEVNVNITKASDDVVTISKDRYEQLLQYEQERKQRQAMILSFMQNK